MRKFNKFDIVNLPEEGLTFKRAVVLGTTEDRIVLADRDGRIWAQRRALPCRARISWTANECEALECLAKNAGRAISAGLDLYWFQISCCAAVLDRIPKNRKRGRPRLRR